MDVELDIYSEMSGRPTDTSDLLSDKFVTFKIRADTVKYKSHTCIQLSFTLLNDELVISRVINNHLTKLKVATSELIENLLTTSQQQSSPQSVAAAGSQMVGLAYHN